MGSRISRRQALVVTAMGIAVPHRSLQAAPAPYRIDREKSSVGFGVMLGDEILTGTMPVLSADLALDFQDVTRSTVQVTLDAANIRMGVFFATDAARSTALLDVARHPTITFRSSRVQPGVTAADAIIQGDVTIRGVTGPIKLQARLSQDSATVGQENAPLTFRLTGRFNRLNFGVSGYEAFVGPDVTLDIRARIMRA